MKKNRQMKTIILYLPLSDSSDIILKQTNKFAAENNYQVEAYRQEGIKPKMVVSKNGNSIAGDTGKLTQTFTTYKKMRQFFIGDQKQNQEDYFVGEFGSDNWARKLKVDPDHIQRFTAGKVIIAEPVHLNDPVKCLNRDKPERERIYVVPNSDKPYRKFDGDYHKHCLGCTFKDGCIMCTLP